MTIGSVVTRGGNLRVALAWYSYRRDVTKAPYVRKRVLLVRKDYDELVRKILELAGTRLTQGMVST